MTKPRHKEVKENTLAHDICNQQQQHSKAWAGPEHSQQGFPDGSVWRIRLPVQGTWETWVSSCCLEDPLEEEMATHSSILAWRIPWTEEPGGLQSLGSQRVGHDWACTNKWETPSSPVSIGDGTNKLQKEFSITTFAPGFSWSHSHSHYPNTISCGTESFTYLVFVHYFWRLIRVFDRKNIWGTSLVA